MAEPDWHCNTLNPAQPGWAGLIEHEEVVKEGGKIICLACGKEWPIKKKWKRP